MKRYDETLDVICMMTGTGNIVPIKIRIIDEDNERQAYMIKSHSHRIAEDDETTPDGMTVKAGTHIFDCAIEFFMHTQNIKLYYEPDRSKWTMFA